MWRQRPELGPAGRDALSWEKADWSWGESSGNDAGAWRLGRRCW